MTYRTGVLCLVVAVHAAAVAHAHEGAHDSDMPTPSVVTPPLDGAAMFANRLASCGTGQLTTDELFLAHESSRLFNEAEEESHEGKRMRAESLLLQLVAGYGDVIGVDMTEGRPSAASDTRRRLAGDSGFLLLRIDGGEDTIRFVTQSIDVEAWPEPDPPRKVPYYDKCTTWVLMELARVPQGSTVFNVLFTPQSSSEAPRLDALVVEAPPQGRMAVTFADEKGLPTPVMARLTSRVKGQLRRPSNAIEFSPQMDDIAGGPGNGPGLPEPLLLPPPAGGLYWCVPGGFDMALPAGEWEIHIHHGTEYRPIHDTFFVRENETTKRSYTLERWTNMAERGWYSGDDHVHARLTSDDDAQRLLTWAKAADVNVVNVLQMGNHMRTYYEQRGFGPDFRVQDGQHGLVPGQEDPRYIMGHSIGLNLRSIVRDMSMYLLNDWVADEIHRQGGLYGHAHLSAVGPPLFAFSVHRDMTLLIPEAKSDFGSILQSFSMDTGLYYDFLNLGYKLTASSGTDTPYSSSIGGSRVYVYLGDSPFTPDAWFDGMKKGHTFVTNGPMVELRVEDALPGDELRVEDSRPLTVRARAWGLAGHSAPASLRLVRFGATVQEAAPSPEADSILIETTVDSGFGFWLAAHVVGRDGTQAHTTPVYVVRDGFRFWDVEQAETLIRKREETLDEIEALLVAQQKKWTDGAISPADYYNGVQARLAPQALARVAEIRPRYQELRDILVREIPQRQLAAR